MGAKAHPHHSRVDSHHCMVEVVNMVSVVVAVDGQRLGVGQGKLELSFQVAGCGGREGMKHQVSRPYNISELTV